MNADHVQFVKDNKAKIGALAALAIGVVVVFLFKPFEEKGTASAGGPGEFTPQTGAAGKTPQQQKQMADQEIQRQQDQAADHVKKGKPSGGS